MRFCFAVVRVSDMITSWAGVVAKRPTKRKDTADLSGAARKKKPTPSQPRGSANSATSVVVAEKALTKGLGIPEEVPTREVNVASYGRGKALAELSMPVLGSSL